jgi:hypothetical protein
MEGLAVVVAGIALLVGIVALVLVLRPPRRAGDTSPSAARSAELERHVAQLSQRLEIVEAEADALRSGVVPEPRVVVSPLPRETAAISRIGLVRFNAFEDTGGASSFALALVDDDGDGIVLTSLHSRATTRVYVKTIRRGVADAPLSDEEDRALKEAGITATL